MSVLEEECCSHSSDEATRCRDVCFKKYCGTYDNILGVIVLVSGILFMAGVGIFVFLNPIIGVLVAITGSLLVWLGICFTNCVTSSIKYICYFLALGLYSLKNCCLCLWNFLSSVRWCWQNKRRDHLHASRRYFYYTS